MDLQMTWEEIERRLARASVRFLERDTHLLRVNANERSMTHKYALYLETEFPDYDVDSEYNRKGDLPKELHVEGGGVITEDDENATTVFPDIIVHHRGQPSNLLVIEAKKNGGNDARDRRKLQAFMLEESYRYAFAALLRFNTGNEPTIVVNRYLPQAR